MRFEAWLLLFALFQLQPQRKRVFFFRLHFLFGLFLCLVRFYCFWMVRSARLYAQFSHWDERTHTRTFTQSISFFCVCIKMYRSDLQAMHNEFLAEKCVCVYGKICWTSDIDGLQTLFAPTYKAVASREMTFNVYSHSKKLSAPAFLRLIYIFERMSVCLWHTTYSSIKNRKKELIIIIIK